MKRSNIRAAAIMRQRRRDAKRPTGTYSMSTHCLKAGLEPELAAGLGNALRTKAAALGLTPVKGRTWLTCRGRVGKDTGVPVHRFDRDQYVTALTAYRPRAERFAQAQALLLIDYLVTP